MAENDNDPEGNRPAEDWPEEDGGEHQIFIIIGQVAKRRGGKKSAVHVMLRAPDDDGAVRETLNALAREGYAEAELDQIGLLDGIPDEEPHASAYQGVLEGEVAIINFD